MIDREEDSERPVERGGPRRKGPIVNQRGPSELSKAIQMLGTQSSRPNRGPRKNGPSGLSKGTVVRIDRSKGYGFIVDSAGEQRFFHRTAVLDGGFDGLQEQQAVDFEPYADERGARAQKVRPAGVVEKGVSSKPAKAPQKPTPKSPTARTPSWKSDLSPFRNGTGAPSSRKRPLI